MRLTTRPVLLILLFSLLLPWDSWPQEEPKPAGPTPEQQRLIKAAGAAVRSAEEAVSAAVEARNAVERVTALLKLHTSSPAANEATLLNLDALAQDAQAVVRDTLFTRLKARNEPLDKMKTALTSAQGALKKDDNSPVEIARAWEECQESIKKLDAELTALPKSAKELQDQLLAAYSFAGTIADALTKSLDKLLALTKLPVNDQLAASLARQLLRFPDTNRLRHLAEEKWAPLEKSLDAALGQAKNNLFPNATAPDAEAAKKTVTDKWAALDGDATTILGKFSSWFDTLGASAAKAYKETQDSITGLVEDRQRNSSAANDRLSSDSELLAALRAVTATWYRLVPTLSEQDETQVELDKAAKSARELDRATATLSSTLARLQDALSGDRSQFKADQVSLYYFTDVRRLMDILNPATREYGGIREAEDEAALARKKLTTAELDLIETQAAVSTSQTRVLELKEELRQTRADTKLQGRLWEQSSRKLDQLKSRLDSADKKVKDAKDTVQAERATRERDALASRVTDATRDADHAKADNEAASQRLEKLNNEQEGLPAQIEDAQKALSTAQLDVVRKRRLSLDAAQDEMAAFVRARDNAPYWFARADASSTDPAHKVEIYGFPDSKTLFLRGEKKDLLTVKEIIALIDRPAPQARITLWTLQLNSTGGFGDKNRGVKRFNKALSLMEMELANVRAYISASLSYFRDCINEQANISAIPLSTRLSPADAYRVARMRGFYSLEILFRLGLDPKNPDSFALISQWSVPDPAGTTTLGEALLVLSLASRKSREEVFTRFEAGLPTKLNDLGLPPPPAQKTVKKKTDKGKDFCDLVFTLTRRMLDLDEKRTVPIDLSASQLEIVLALESVALRKIVDRASDLAAEVSLIEQKLKDPALSNRQKEDLRNPLRGYLSELVPLCAYLWDRYGISPQQLAPFPEKVSPAKLALPDQEKYAGEMAAAASALAARFRSQNPLRLATPRVAAADQMLKEMIIAVEDDVDRLFVNPALNRLRTQLASDKNLQVGILQRASLLVTNRLVARVDPRASAQLGMGETTDIIQSLEQIGQIVLAAKTGGLSTTLGALNAQKREPEPEIYSLTTGSEFKVTPIFDPSGQALRFKFDYIAASHIQEPNGSTNTQLPRIERHTINTEVQISNLELREISRFESNAKLGLIPRYWGGIPIFKDLPYFRPWVPLFGWFVRKKGESAATQESVIFGQTTIYPTIADMVDLLTTTDRPEK